MWALSKIKTSGLLNECSHYWQLWACHIPTDIYAQWERWKKTRFADGLCTGHSLFYFNTAEIRQICMCFFFSFFLSLLPDMHLPTHMVYIASVLFYFYSCVTLWLRNKLTTTITNSSEFCCCSTTGEIDLSISAWLVQFLIWSAFLDVT